MELPVNQFKRGIKADKPQIGLWSSLSSHYSVEVIAGSGFDWLLLDTEHSPNDLENVVTQLQAVSAYPTTAIVRPAWNDMVLIKRFLDVGVQTLLIPYVQTPEEAAQAVAYTRYPLRGVRGVAGTTRATRFGRVKDYFKRAEEELCVLVQVETRLGLDNLEAIANTDGVDGVFIGPADLSAGLGHLGDMTHPEVKKAIDDAIGRIRKSGKAPGILTGVEAEARHYLEIGCLFVAVGADVGLLARESEKLCAKFKS
jgi:4-hydroxy-2-oxoheptanedioate aldolase